MAAGPLHLLSGGCPPEGFFSCRHASRNPYRQLPPADHHIISQGQNLAGFNGGPLAGCLCSQSSLDNVVGNVESNSMAKSAGVTRGKIIAL